MCDLLVENTDIIIHLFLWKAEYRYLCGRYQPYKFTTIVKTNKKNVVFLSFICLIFFSGVWCKPFSSRCLAKAHISVFTTRKVKRKEDISFFVGYKLIRKVMNSISSESERMLWLARLLDAAEEDYQKEYGKEESPPPFKGGYEAMVRRQMKLDK